VEHRERLLQREQVVPELVDDGPRVRADADADERLDASTERAGIDLGVEPPDDTADAQRPHPGEAARRGEPDAGGELLVREPTVLLQLGQDRPVDSVEP
jgi:hypothetical protein